MREFCLADFEIIDDTFDSQDYEYAQPAMRYFRPKELYEAVFSGEYCQYICLNRRKIPGQSEHWNFAGLGKREADNERLVERLS